MPHAGSASGQIDELAVLSHENDGSRKRSTVRRYRTGVLNPGGNGTLICEHVDGWQSRIWGSLCDFRPILRLARRERVDASGDSVHFAGLAYSLHAYRIAQPTVSGPRLVGARGSRHLQS
jgi:hypothetical protein